VIPGSGFTSSRLSWLATLTPQVWRFGQRRPELRWPVYNKYHQFAFKLQMLFRALNARPEQD
jgi:hypothetical protein